MRKFTSLLITAALTLLVSSQAFAAHAPPGNINNTADVTYEDDNGNSTTITSNTVSTLINTVNTVAVTPATTTANAQNTTTVRYFMNIENTGNVTDTFALAINQSGADDWEPTLVTIYADTGTIGVWNGEAIPTTSTGPIDSEESYPVIVVFDVPANAIGTEDTDQNIFTLTATGVSNDSSGDITTTIQAPLITTTLDVSSTSLAPGDTVTFTATVTSTGTLAPGLINFASVIPAGFTSLAPASVTTGGGSVSTVGQNVTGSNNTLTATGAGNDTWIIVWSATVDPTTAGTHVAKADASSDITGDTITKTGTAPTISIASVFSVAVTTPADIVITPGDIVSFAITVTNTGNNLDTFDLSYTGGSNMGSYFFYSDAGLTTLLTDTGGGAGVDTGPLAAGAGMDIYIGVAGDVTHVYTDDDTLVVTATSTDDPAVPAASHDTGPFTVDVQAPSVTILKAVSAATANPGDTLTYSITVTNLGDAPAENVVIDDFVPTYTTYVDNSLAGTFSGGLVHNNDIANGDTVLENSGAISAGVDATLTLDANGGADDSYVLTFDVLVD